MKRVYKITVNTVAFDSPLAKKYPSTHCGSLGCYGAWDTLGHEQCRFYESALN
jgi:hypothetical protein